MDKSNQPVEISFIIPAYNEEKFIVKCLNSILDEVYRENVSYEIIVVNNNSVDKTKELVLQFNGVKLIDEYRQGLTFARQTGFLKSSGKLIANIDADTILPKGWLKTVLNEFKNKKIIALSGPQIYYDAPKKILIYEWIFYRIAYLTYLINKYILNKSSMLQGGNFIIRRDMLEKIGGFNTNILFWGEDTDIAKRLHKLGDVKFTFKLPIYASGRRLLREGIFKTAWRYSLNYFYIIFFDKPFHSEINIQNKSEYTFLNLHRINFYLTENRNLVFILGIFIFLFGMSYFILNHYFEYNFFYRLEKFKAEIISVFKK
ncbi:MAG: glycosyltransferase family 2 protein [Patescibacteria group bacterium]|nr:glycosyltransferase family 2 protein [Patescibacteria group bacterium]MCX7589366.1 glycosyltransferase family 2 protein [Patescibacteria group bacterium]MDW8279891.1 glycosyltransferase family 2 protein [bacterium]